MSLPPPKVYHVRKLASPYTGAVGALAGACVHLLDLAGQPGAGTVPMVSEEIYYDFKALQPREPVAKPRWVYLPGDPSAVAGELLLWVRVRLECLLHVVTDGTAITDLCTNQMPVLDHAAVRIDHVCPKAITTQIYHSVIAGYKLPEHEVHKLNVLLDRLAYNGPRYLEMPIGGCLARERLLRTLGRAWLASRPLTRSSEAVALGPKFAQLQAATSR
jgi:hypothetical protein